jgi:hypothetical protein
MTSKQQEKEVRRLTSELLSVAEKSHPMDFAAFCGALLANVSGALPTCYWATMMKITPCDIPGCNCHVLAAKTMEALNLLREDHRITLAKQAEKN